MITHDWTEIPGRLADAGFAVCYSHISYDPARPLWSAKASRDGREWITMGEDLCSAFLELERQTAAASEDWRRIMGHEVHAPAFGTETE